MKTLYPSFVYPIRNNVKSPLPYIDKIQDGDLIILDNYFPWDWGWESELWDIFLWEYLKKWLECKIICISDYGKTLVDKFCNWDIVNQNGDIIWWYPDKRIQKFDK